MKLNDKYNLGLRKLLPEFRSNNKSVLLGEETIVAVGVGSTQYMSFPDLMVDNNGKIHLIYRQGTGHNLGNDGHILHRTSIDGGITWDTPVTIVVNGGGTYNVTNGSIMQTSTGRIIVCFDKQDLPSSLGTQRTYLIYSDDGGETWNSNGGDGNEILLINDRPSTFLRSIGAAIEIDNVIYFPQYSQNGNEYSRILKSEDFGLTWSLLTNITDGTAATVLNAGETNLLIRGDGVVLALMRHESAGENYMTYSTDNCASWYPSPWKIGDIRSKNPMAKSPNGTILTVGRQADNWETMYGYSSDGGFSFSFDKIDERTNQFMYAGVVWDSINNRWVVVYSIETGTEFQSPTNLVCKFIYEV